MKTITTQEAETHLSLYLAEVEQGNTFLISRGQATIAMLVPMPHLGHPQRPLVGDILGEPFAFAPAALAPLTEAELAAWGL